MSGKTPIFYIGDYIRHIDSVSHDMPVPDSAFEQRFEFVSDKVARCYPTAPTPGYMHYTGRKARLNYFRDVELFVIYVEKGTYLVWNSASDNQEYNILWVRKQDQAIIERVDNSNTFTIENDQKLKVDMLLYYEPRQKTRHVYKTVAMFLAIVAVLSGFVPWVVWHNMWWYNTTKWHQLRLAAVLLLPCMDLPLSLGIVAETMLASSFWHLLLCMAPWHVIPGSLLLLCMIL